MAGYRRDTLPAAPELTTGRASCTDALDLVDAAYARPGGPAAKQLGDLCRTCPIAHGCLDHAMTQREDGVWGGTSPYTRTAHGGPKDSR